MLGWQVEKLFAVEEQTRIFLGRKEMWPSQEFLLPKNVDLEEKGSREVVSSVNVNFSGSEVGIGNVIDCDRFSSLNKVVRVTGFVLRYVRNLKAFLIGCESLTPFHMIYEKSFKMDRQKKMTGVREE